LASLIIYFYPVSDLTLPENTVSLAKDQPIEPLKKLLTNWKSYERDVWDLLMKEIFQAIRDRKKVQKFDYDGF